MRQEEASSPDEIFAEIIHLPAGRAGNIICRPRLRRYEIPYLGASAAEAEAQIPVQDLMISVQGGRVRLRSVRLNRTIIPRMANTHDFAGADLGLYQLLCLLRSDGYNLCWSWGSLARAPFLPRVSHGRLVLSLATWVLQPSEVRPLRLARGDERFLRAQELRKQRALPCRLLFGQGDNTLPIDFDNVLSVEAFAALLEEGAEVELREVFPAYDELLCEGSEGRFTHELVVPFLVTSDVPVIPDFPVIPDAAAVGPTAPTGSPPRVTRPGESPALHLFPRAFAPGSRWLYAKLYTGTATADEVLRRVVRPLTELAREAGAERWFFIRYGDPDWHLRLRIEAEPGLLWQQIAPALYACVAPLLEGGQVWRLQLDTYEREVERYGGPVGMALSERLFEADSEAALGIVELLSGDEGNDLRWRFALRGMDLLLNDIGLSIPEKSALVVAIGRGFAEEFGVTPPFERQLDANYRAQRPGLDLLWDPSGSGDDALAPGLSLLAARSLRLAPIVQELRAAARQGQLCVTIQDLGASYLHMQANRLLRGAQRATELVLYDFLRRIYASQLARRRGRT
jgi:thiopeptide-type bacteriocin biosynthesis protein